MSTLVVYERAESLGTLLLGLDEDAHRKRFDSIVMVLKKHNIEVVRYDDVHHREYIEPTMVLPVFKQDGNVIFEGAYPLVDDVCKWFNLDKELFDHVTRTGLVKEANTTRLGLCCAVGQDIYVDPNEEELF